jgi:hypothetical protein
VLERASATSSSEAHAELTFARVDIMANSKLCLMIFACEEEIFFWELDHSKVTKYANLGTIVLPTLSY